jgi:hypothetical protein
MTVRSAKIETKTPDDPPFLHPKKCAVSIPASEDPFLAERFT